MPSVFGRQSIRRERKTTPLLTAHHHDSSTHTHHSPKHTCPHCRRRVHFNKLVCCRLCVTLIEKVNIGKERRQRQHSLPSSLLADIHTVSEGDNWQRTIGSDSKCQVDAVQEWKKYAVVCALVCIAAAHLLATHKGRSRIWRWWWW